MYTTSEAAGLLGWPPDRVRSWCRAGLIRAVQTGLHGHWYIPHSSLEELSNL